MNHRNKILPCLPCLILITAGYPEFNHKVLAIDTVHNHVWVTCGGWPIGFEKTGGRLKAAG
jgi:hypothetical protein